ncbi:uncharacterized protein [Aristolochia californica]|uniref:uncharacterized protein n=1 Tax=Aristolochia californica TaxID=171875 RepID=UPI0035E209A5
MWRQNIFPANQDCDRDVSDFDRITYDNGCLESLGSLCQKEGKDSFSAASQLEILEGRSKIVSATCEVNCDESDTLTSPEMAEDFFSGDEVDVKNFHNANGGFIECARKEATGDLNRESRFNEGLGKSALSHSSFRSQGVKPQKGQHFYSSLAEGSTWCGILKESEDLGCLERSSFHSAAQRERKGRGGKTRPRFSVCFQSKEGPSWPPIWKNGNENTEAFEHTVGGLSVSDPLKDLAEVSERMSEAPQGVVHSMAELLEGLQEKNSLSEGNLEMVDYTKKRRHQIAVKKPLSVLGNRMLDNEDPVEPMESETSSEDEVDGRLQLRLGAPKTTEQTMADRFQKAFDAAEVDDKRFDFPNHKYVGTGLYGRLQQVLQNEKDKHVEFLKQLQAGVPPLGDAACMDVKILSRCLDAKLTVCNCKTIKGSQFTQGSRDLVDDEGSRKITIIFSLRICNNVELEVGNFVRIHPPWKKVQVMENKIIILSTYFSQFGAIN